jgi:hypothetical protein
MPLQCIAGLSGSTANAILLPQIYVGSIFSSQPLPQPPLKLQQLPSYLSHIL